MRSREDVYNQLRTFLTDLFEVPDADIQPEARLAEDLDLDSIDAVDLIVKFQELTGKKIPATEFKSVRTVDDVVEKIHAVVAD